MRRRRLFNVLSVASLILCVTTVGFWLASYFMSPAIQFSHPSGLWQIAARDGKLRLDNAPQREAESDLYLRQAADWNRAWVVEQRKLREKSDAVRDAAFAEMRQGHSDDGPLMQKYQAMVRAQAFQPLSLSPQPRIVSTPFAGYSVSLAIPAVAFAVWPTVCWRQWRRNRIRLVEGLCRSCGYDLRATPDRCPECGVAPTVRPA